MIAKLKRRSARKQKSILEKAFGRLKEGLKLREYHGIISVYIGSM